MNDRRNLGRFFQADTGTPEPRIPRGVWHLMRPEFSALSRRIGVRIRSVNAMSFSLAQVLRPYLLIGQGQVI